MTRLITIIAFTYGIAWIPYFYMLEDEFITIYIRDIQYFLLISYAFELIPKNKIIIRSILLSWMIFCTVEAQQYFILQYNYDIYFNTYLITAGILLTILLYTILKPYKQNSDLMTDPDNIYLCFSKPLQKVSLAGSLLGYAVGGVDIYTGGKMYGFRRKDDRYHCRIVKKHIVARKYLIHDTKIKNNDLIAKYLYNYVKHAKAGKLRIRCISTISPLLSVLGTNYKPKGIFKNIPAVYSTGILNR